MSDATRTAGAKQLPSQACFIAVSYTHLIVPEAKTMTDEEAAAFLRLALTSEEARAYLKKRTEGGKSE